MSVRGDENFFELLGVVASSEHYKIYVLQGGKGRSPQFSDSLWTGGRLKTHIWCSRSPVEIARHAAEEAALYAVPLEYTNRPARNLEDVVDVGGHSWLVYGWEEDGKRRCDG